ncbi:hypothetical protein [Polyangium sorediatum]|uniref:Uncharacterized protein n=1 Tax=Polyangium sorediatum TaxID=889274 RepID=A0ABT6NL65_9BACT|nr:hypothetical protein [Polyangium sorediatum]MDI1429056.1 hypothetical protein [Polyangium sorediatum]
MNRTEAPSTVKAWKRYAVVFLSAGLGLGARALLMPAVGNAVPFITMFFAVVLSGWYGEFRAGMLADARRRLQRGLVFPSVR